MVDFGAEVIIIGVGEKFVGLGECREHVCITYMLSESPLPWHEERVKLYRQLKVEFAL